MPSSHSSSGSPSKKEIKINNFDLKTEKNKTVQPAPHKKINIQNKKMRALYKTKKMKTGQPLKGVQRDIWFFCKYYTMRKFGILNENCRYSHQVETIEIRDRNNQISKDLEKF